MNSLHMLDRDGPLHLDIMSSAVRTRLLEGQNEILRLVTAGAALPVVLDRAARLCQETLPEALCSILLVDADMIVRHGAAPSLPAAYCDAIDGIRAGSGVGSCGTAIAERRLVVVGDIATHSYWQDYKSVALAHGLHACWSTCIMDGERRPLGSFAVYYRQPREPAPWELDLIDGLCGLAGVAIERHETAQRQAALIEDLKQQRLRAEAAMARFRESEQRFRDLTAASSDWYWEQDEDLRYTFTSSSSWPASGIEAVRVYGRTLRETKPFGVSDEQLRRLEADLEQRKPFRDFRYQRIDADERIQYISINGVPVFDELTGAFKGYRGTGRNITDEVRTTETFRAVIEAMPAMVSAKDTTGRYVLMNTYQASLYGTTPEQAIGKTAADLLGPRYGSYTDQFDQRVIATGEPTGFYEEAYECADGVKRDWLSAKLPLKDARGVVRFVISTAMDITPLKDTEQQLLASRQALTDAIVQLERSSRAKSDFLTNMSHELRTPLNAVIGFSEVMSNELMGPLGSERYRDYAEDIYRSGRYLHDLITDMLDMAKIEAGRRDLLWEEIDAAVEIEEVIRMVRQRAENGQVEMRTELPAAPVALKADRRAFRQILLNLVGNAVKFTPAGGSVTLRLGARSGCTTLQVIDTGIGIAAEQIDKLGTPFFRIEDPQQATTEGTGLGLALTKSLVKLHGWRMRIDSKVAAGTTITVEMPDPAGSNPITAQDNATAA